MYTLQTYVLATNSWLVIHTGTWGDCASEQRVSAGYTRIVRVTKRA
jgi:hypothetical protein